MADQTAARLNPRAPTARPATARRRPRTSHRSGLAHRSVCPTLRARAGERSRRRPGGGLDSTASAALPTLRLGGRDRGGTDPRHRWLRQRRALRRRRVSRRERTRRLACHRAAQHGEDQPRHRDTRRDRLRRPAATTPRPRLTWSRRSIHAPGPGAEARACRSHGAEQRRAALGGLLYVAGGFHLGPGHRGDHRVGHRVRPSEADLAVRRPDAHGPRAAAAGDGRPVSLRSRRALRRRNSLTTIERYDPKSNRWQTVSPMHESRVAAGITAANIDGRQVLVAVGGAIWQDFEILGSRRTTEVYDLATGRWQVLRAELPEPRGSLGCANEADGTVWRSAAAQTPARSPRSWPSSSPAWTWPASETASLDPASHHSLRSPGPGRPARGQARVGREVARHPSG
jgi:hypothetical protein